MSDTRVYKYVLGFGETQHHVPRDGRVVHVAMQDGRGCVWMLVDADNADEPRRFAVIGTGHPVPDGRYVGSLMDAPYVWHVFEVAA